jgi:hypothetical protein
MDLDGLDKDVAEILNLAPGGQVIGAGTAELRKIMEAMGPLSNRSGISIKRVVG